MGGVQSTTGTDALLNLDCTELVQAFRQGRCTPVDALEALESAVTAGNPTINAFCHVDWESARASAVQAAARYRSGNVLGPLDGVPVSIKDLIDVQGWPTRRGSKALADAPAATADAPAVQWLRQGGAVLFGKTTTTEFGWTIRSDNPIDGLTRNPLNLTRSAGGSSSGAAAQVAAGWGPLALGSDAGGSVRVPASYCGLVGFKPTFGTIPMIPSSAFTEFAHLGVFSRSIRDCRLAMDVVGRPDPRDIASTFERVRNARGAPLRLGWTLTLGSDLAPKPHTVSAFMRVLEQLRAAGHEVIEVEPRIQHCSEVMWTIWRARMLESFHAWPEATRMKLGAGLLGLYREGEHTSLLEVSQARIALRQMAVNLGQVFAGIDLLLTPMMTDSAPVALEAEAAERAPVENWFRHSGYSFPFNVTGQPALSMPMGQCPDGLPLGVQIVGRKFHDAQVLDLGATLEAA